MLVFECEDQVFLLQGLPDFIQPIEQCFAARRVHRKGNRFAGGGGDHLGVQVGFELVSGLRGDLVEQAVHRAFGQLDGQQSVLDAVLRKDVGEAGSNQHADAVSPQRPRRMFAAGAAAEIAAREQDRCTGVARQVQDKVWIRASRLQIHAGFAQVDIAQAVEEVRAKARALDRLHELLGQYGIRNVTVYGDTRFDRVLDVRNQARELPEFERFVGERCQTLIAGSSWPQDEEILIPYFNEHPEMKLIIAPHEIHREHLMYIESLLKRPSVRLSDVMQDKSLLEGKDCLIVDSFGLLSSIYRYGTIAYIGGGFGAGIHNTLEAAVYGIPVLFGPRFQKFKEARDLIKVGGGFSVASKDEFVAKMDELLTYAEVLKAAGESAGQFVKGNAGATDGILKELAL